MRGFWSLGLSQVKASQQKGLGTVGGVRAGGAYRDRKECRVRGVTEIGEG